MKKLIILLIVVFMIIYIGLYILLYLYNSSNDRAYKKDNIEEIPNIKVKTTDLELNKEYKISDIITIDNGEIIDDYVIDTSTLGRYNISYNYLFNKIKNSETLNIVVVDTLKPEIKYKDIITITKGDNIDLTQDVVVTDNSNEKIDVEVVGNYDINIVGEYDLEYMAHDSCGNTNRVKFKLIVK